MDAHSSFASAGSHVPQPGVLAGNPEPPSLDEVRVILQKTGPSAVEMAKRDLYASLQLLTNRIQYLTGASSATIALREGPELLCEASAGPMATELGASVRADPDFINQSIIAEQIFCCNNTRNAISGDGKSYKELGIKAIMVMPLFRGSEVVGVLELLADRTNAFNDSHGELLERFAEMVFTALAHADAAKRAAIETIAEEKVKIPVRTPWPKQEVPIVSTGRPVPEATSAVIETQPDKTVEILPESTPAQREIPIASVAPSSATAVPELPPAAASAVWQTAPEKKVEIPPESISGLKETPIAAVESPEAPPAATNVKVQFCESCGFPVSEGRKLCLDCEEGRTGAEPGAAPGFLSQLEREDQQGWLENHFYTVGTIVMALLTVLALVLKFR